MREIKTSPVINRSVSVPGSKSYTHRIIIAAALSNGRCDILNPLKSEDTLLTVKGLRMMGVVIDEKPDHMVILGRSGDFKPAEEEIHLGNSGTSVRLLTGICGIGNGRYVITGTSRMQERPIQDLLDGMVQLGIKAKSIRGNGCPPIEIIGRKIDKGKLTLDCHVSSQYLSSMLLISPFSDGGVEIQVVNGPVSKPYIDMTLEVMERFGVGVDRDGYDRFFVSGKQIYRSGTYAVEPDCSQAGYFWAAAAITGASISVRGVHSSSMQGDVRFSEVLEKMGCLVTEEKDGICVTGREMKGVTVDMSDMPDMVPTLAVVAAFAEGTTQILNVAHLRAKESNRLESVANELMKIGIDARCSESGMTIEGGVPRGGHIDTYNDHRMAMSFAVAGLKTPGIFIENENCVSKSFPDFWEVFESLYG